MVHSRVNKWSTYCFEFLEADVDHLLTLEFCFNFLVLLRAYACSLSLLNQKASDSARFTHRSPLLQLLCGLMGSFHLIPEHSSLDW